MHPSLILDDDAGRDRCGHLLVWAWRLIVTGRMQCPLLESEFEDACGEHARNVFGALCSFLCALAAARRRRLEVGHPGWAQLTPDERRLLVLIAAAQNDNRALLEAHLCWLARPESRRAVHQSALDLADALGDCGLHIALPITSSPAARKRRIAPATPRLLPMR